MNDFLYLALGDSVATGTLTNFSRVTSYTAYFYRALRNQYKKVRMVSLAKDGDTSRNLLNKLTWNSAFQNWVRRADFITISIGGNNLMQAASIPGFTSINKHRAEQGMRAFCNDWEHIINRLRTINPNCTLLVLTIYNPYNQTRRLNGAYWADRGLHELTDRYLSQMNETIRAACAGQYRIAEIDKLFMAYSDGRMGRVVSLYSSGLYLLRNPHPTPYGHMLIGRAHAALLNHSSEKNYSAVTK